MLTVFNRFGLGSLRSGLLAGGRIRILTHHRSLQYLGLLLVLLPISVLVPVTPLRGGPVFYAVAETLAANLAMLVGLAALPQYSGTRNPLYLFTALGFLGAALLDGFHAVTVWGLAGAVGEQAVGSGSRWFLPLWLWLGVWVSSAERPMAKLMRETPAAVCLAGAGLTLLCLLWVRVSPRAAPPEGVLGHVAAAVLFFAAVEATLRRRNWPHDIFEHCLMLSLIAGFLLNTLFLSGSHGIQDPLFVTAQHLKNLSYVVVLGGLVVGTQQLFQRAQGTARALGDANAALRREISEHQSVRRQYQDLAVSLEQRVEERSSESAQAQQAALRAKEEAEEARRLEERAHRQLRGEMEERLEFEKALQESESRLQLALSVSQVGIWTWEPHEDHAVWDNDVFRIFGQTPEEFIPSSAAVLELVHPDDAANVRRAVEQAIGQGADFDIAYRVVWPDGRVRHIMSRARAIHNDAGTTTRIIGTVVDVTEHKRGEEELRKRGEELGHMVKVQRCLYEMTQLLEQAETPLEQICRRTVELLALSWKDPPNTFARIVVQGREYAGDNWRDSGRKQWAEIVAGPERVGLLEIGFAGGAQEDENPRQEEIGVVKLVAASLGRTIEYRRAVEGLRRTEQRYHSLFDHMISACALYEIIVDETGRAVDYRFLEVNPSFERLAGLKAKETLGKTAREVLPRIDQQWIEICGQVALSGEPAHMERYDEQLGRYFEAAAFSPEKGRFAVILNDITERREAEGQRAAERNLLRTLIDNLPDSVYVKDTAGRYLVANAANLKRIGLDDEAEARGKTVFDFFPAGHARLYDADDRAVIKTGNAVFDHEEPYRYARGELRLYSTTKVPLLDGGGRVVGLVGISRDITARKLAEQTMRESRRRMETLLGNLPGMAYRCTNDSSWTMHFASKGCEALTGFTPAELLESNFAELIHPEDRAAVWDHVQQAIGERRPYQLEYRIRAADGGDKWVWEQGTAVMSETGEVEALEGFITDISTRRRAEEELAHKAKELAASNAELEQFAYAASHDLQEPLRMIAGYTQLLARRYSGRLDGEADEFIRFIVDGTQRMQTLIRDLLAYSRAGRTSLAPELVDLEDCARASLANLQATVEENAAVVELNALPKLSGHRSQLIQLFQNLVGNAVKYHGDAPPRVRISSEQHGREWLFSVEDNGIGIDPQHREQVFELFRRLHSRSEYTGTGIGLAMCKKIVESHGGRIWVDSEPGRGATFRFTLPADPVDAP